MGQPEINQGSYFLRSPRLGFRWWREEDLPLAIALWGDPEVTRFISKSELSDEAVKGLLSEQIAFGREQGIQYWPLFLLENGEHVGCCGLRPNDPNQRVYELGAHIRSTWWRRGFAEEAARAVIDYAFSALGATALFAGHNPNNNASRQLLQKLGFQHTHDEYYAPTDLQHPSYILKARQKA